MKTHFASPERADQPAILKQNEAIQTSEILSKTLDNLTNVVAILNANRQAVFINKALLESFGFDSTGFLLGQRPGEIMNCIHANEMEAGCGTSQGCRYCGAGQSIVESQQTLKTVTRECRITATINDEPISFDLSTTSSPMEIQGEKFTLFVASDISDEKRRHAMERIFFHDVINKAGSLDGLLQILEDSNDIKEIKEVLKLLQSVSTDLVEEILTQRDLVRAEKGEISVNAGLVDPIHLIYDIAAQMRAHVVTKGHEIEVMIACDAKPVLTDRVLLNRILTNMIKNAIEATINGGKVKVILLENENYLSFSVHNDKLMPLEVRNQVFQRSFSTKGLDRGLGTYSMKLLGEKYLRGRVYFTSEKSTGTHFFIDLPKHIKVQDFAGSVK